MGACWLVLLPRNKLGSSGRRISTEKMPSSDWQGCRAFLVNEKAQPTVGGGTPGQAVMVGRKPAEHEPGGQAS